jgi:hypothetical protein
VLLSLAADTAKPVVTAHNLQSTVDTIQHAIDISLVSELSRHGVFQEITGKQVQFAVQARHMKA